MTPDQSGPRLGLHHSGLGAQAAREHGGAGVAPVQDVKDLIALWRVPLLHLVLLCTLGIREGVNSTPKRGFVLSRRLGEEKPEFIGVDNSSNYVALFRWLATNGNQQVIGSHAICLPCHWSPSVTRTNEDQHKNAISPQLLCPSGGIISIGLKVGL